MIPNIEQLLLVCGVSILGVGLIVWVMLKIPLDSKDDKDRDGNKKN
jgi:hypothetical protein